MRSEYISHCLESLIQKFIHYLIHQKRYSDNTYTAYQRDLDDFFSFIYGYKGHKISSKTLQNIEHHDMRAWLAQRLRDDKLPQSNARALSAVKRFYKYCAQYHDIKNDIISMVQSPKTPSLLPKPLDVHQAINTIDTANDLANEIWVGKRDCAVLCLLYGAGLRISEALNLNVNDWQSQNGSMMIKGKGDKTRYVPILDKIQLSIDDYLKHCPYAITPSRPLFVGVQGKRLSRAVIAKKMRDIRHLLGLPDSATPHALRHSFATHILAQSDDLRSIQELLGHQSLSSTQVYTKVNTAMLLDDFRKANHQSPIQ